MEIRKEQIVAGIIGGVVSLGLLFATKKLIRGGKCHRNRWMLAKAKVNTMESPNMPAAIGPYCKGKLIEFKDGSRLCYSSGQLGLDPRTNELVSDSVEDQAEQVIKNLKALAEDNGLTLRDTAKNVVYLTDMGDFATVNEVYKKYYDGDFPARTCIAVRQLPKGGLVEIESVFFRAGPSCEERKRFEDQ